MYIFLIIFIFIYLFYNKKYTYKKIINDDDITIMKNSNNRTLIIDNNQVIKIYDNNEKEIRNHLSTRNLIDNSVSYKGAKIPKIYNFTKNTITMEHVGNMTYKDWNKQQQSAKNIKKVNLKIKEFLNIGTKLNHNDLHMENIRLSLDKNGDVVEVYIIDLEYCSDYLGNNLFKHMHINFKNNLYRIPIIKHLCINDVF
jgi:RIO-like serine/threonine protein kinase